MVVAEEVKHVGLVLAKWRGCGTYYCFLSFYVATTCDHMFQRWLQEHLLFPSFSRNVTLPHQEVNSTSLPLNQGRIVTYW